MNPKVLPPDVYDALELSALAFAGIGSVFAYEVDSVTPRCVLGHLDTMCGTHWRTEFAALMLEAGNALKAAFDTTSLLGIAIEGNDRAFTKAEQYAGTRISWPEYCRRLNIVRGDTPSAGDAVST